MRENERYSRQIILPEVGRAGQMQLLNAKVLVVGAGGLGNAVIQYLAAAGIGNIGIADYDLIEISNLARQPLFSEQDIGKCKASVAAQKTRLINNGIKIDAIEQKLSTENADAIMAGYDIIADCSDNFSTRYLINDICVLLHKPYVFAAIEGWEGQLSVFNYNGGPRYRDFFPQAPLSTSDCNALGVIATLPAVIGSLQANEIIKCILKLPGVLSGRMLIMNLLSHHTHYLEIGKLPKKAKIPSVEISRQQWESGHYCVIDIRYEPPIEETFFEDLLYKRMGFCFEAVPYYELMDFPFEKGKKYLLLCEKGNKSHLLAEKIHQEKPDIEIYSLRGGIAGLH